MPRQSALDPFGPAAGDISTLFWIMTSAGAVIWAAVVAISLYAYRSNRHPGSARTARWLIVAGGLVIPVTVLTALLTYSFSMLPGLVAAAPPDALRLHVTGEQWWWRVTYRDPTGTEIPTPNEIRLPAGSPAALTLASHDVVHSFWVPSLAGKMDMIPGRTTRLVLQPDAPGEYTGICAEYCGTSHAFMMFRVVVHERPEFESWLAAQARPADVPPPGSQAAAGANVFLAAGCGACHSVRGTPAAGRIGPDLTHVASRRTIAARMLPATAETFEAWITAPQTIKPGAHMPAFGMLSAADRRALAIYLEHLK